MTTYLSNRLTAPIQPEPSPSVGGMVYGIYASVATPSTFTTTDSASMFFVPAGARVMRARLWATDLDSGTTITLNVGDTSSATRYFSASTVGQAATSADMTVTTGLGFLNTARTLVSIVPNAGPATTAGTVFLFMEYLFEGIAS